MSRRSKLEKFEELYTMPNVYQNFSFKAPYLEHEGQPIDNLAGSWNKRHFKRDAPLCLELACGRGEYCLGLADMHSEKHYLGLDIKGARIWKGARIALENKLTNIAFLRTKIELIEHFFSAGEIDELWITFPDPFLKKSKSNKRLTSPFFLDKYRKILKKQHVIHLKTDSQELVEFTLDIIHTSPDIHLQQLISDVHHDVHDIAELYILTYYEKMHIANGKRIYYIRFTLDI